jgi:hypothetical protein
MGHGLNHFNVAARLTLTADFFAAGFFAAAFRVATPLVAARTFLEDLEKDLVVMSRRLGLQPARFKRAQRKWSTHQLNSE